MNHKSNMNVGGESHGRVVPAKRPNKDGKPSAEGAEGRRATKENTEQTTASQTQSSLPLVTAQHKGNRNLRRSDEDSPGHIVPFEGTGQQSVLREGALLQSRGSKQLRRFRLPYG
jgi:hypothetical protein